MVTSASCSHRAAQMSWAELLEPRTTHFLPAVVVGAAELAGMLLRPSERVGPGDPRDIRHAGHARRQDQLPGPQHDRLPCALDGHRPVLRVFVILSAAAVGGMPVVQLHDLGVHLQPIADLVLGREHRPMVGKRQVGKVVVPHGVVQAERLVAIPPRIAGAMVLLDDDRRHFQAFQPRRQADAALSAADDDAVGLSRVTQFRLFLSLSLQPRLPIPEGTVLRRRPCGSPRFFSSNPLSSVIVVSSVQHFPALRRR